MGYSQRGKLQRSGTQTENTNPFGTNTQTPDTTKKKQEQGDKAKVCDCNKDLEYDQERDIAYFKNSPNQPPFTGTCITLYPENNKLQIKATYVDGKEDGTTYKFHDNGVLNVEINNSMGIPHGEWKFYTKDSVLRWSKNYNMGELDGEQKWFYEDGGLKRLETYSNGAKDGPSIEYYEDSILKKEVGYKDNELHGPYKKYAKDSANTLIIDQNYHKGKLDGACNFYYESGQVGYTKFYKKGEPDGTWNYYFENGKDKAIEMYKNGKKVGVWRSYHSNQKLQSEIIYKKDEEVSKREYDRFGREL